MFSSLTRLSRAALIAGLVLIVLGVGKPARANITCFQDLRDCYGRAATRENWVDMWLAGLDCELAFTDCTRRALIGR